MRKLVEELVKKKIELEASLREKKNLYIPESSPILLEVKDHILTIEKTLDFLVDHNYAEKQK